MTDAQLASGIDRSELDPAVRPQDDLFRHVNGKWMDRTEIPDDKARWGSFHQLAEDAENAVRDIIEESQTNPDGEEGVKIGALYASFMDVDRANALGATPLADQLARVAAVDSIESFLRLSGEFEAEGVGGFLQLFVDNDPGNPERYLVFAEQGGITLPDESYFREDTFAEIREAYRVHLQTMFELAGIDDAAARADRVFALETAIASKHWDNVATRDSEKTYNLYSWDEAAALAAGADLDGPNLAVWRDAIGAADAVFAEIVVREPSFLEGLGELLVAEQLESWKDWLAWKVVHGAAPYLSEEFGRANFDFYGKTLTGTPQQRERWKRGVSLVEGMLGEAVGRIYVDRHFGATSKDEMDVLVGFLVEAYRDSIENLEWMSPETRTRALEKLDKFTPKIGFPVKWRDYSALELEADDLLGNVRRASRFEMDRELGKIGKPLDRDEWFMTPQTINAYYNPGFNEIVFPAAILQYPFFDAGRDAAANYGAIGAVIGHEIGHGFDDQGRPRGVRGADRVAHRAVQRAGSRPGARPPRERCPDDRREHRRPRRARHRLEGVPAVARGRGASGHRRSHRRGAVLPLLGAGLAAEGTRRRGHPTAVDRPALAERVPLQPDRPEHRRLLRGVRRDRVRRRVARPRGARHHLVAPRLAEPVAPCR
jgi:putative endopeptidase